MRYKVVRIDEDIDFGCEERVEGAPVMAVVTLLDEEETELVLKQEDQMLYDADINEGDFVVLKEDGKIYKVDDASNDEASIQENVSKTLDYYNQNAKSFCNNTKDVAFSQTQDKFLQQLKEGDRILDFGCGSGRDSKYFLSKGYNVSASDGSEELCKIASAYTGIPVRCMLFQDLSEVEYYDGIWACSSILHLSKEELADVMKKITIALKSGGILYTSFKYGLSEGIRNGRYFTDFTEESFLEYMKQFKDLTVEEWWISGDVRPGREQEKWLNVILKRL